MSVLPSLRYTLGFFLPQVFDDRDNYIDDVTDADLYKCVELNCELPGAGQLQVRTGRTAVVVVVIVVVALVAYVLMVLLLFVYSSVCNFVPGELDGLRRHHRRRADREDRDRSRGPMVRPALAGTISPTAIQTVNGATPPMRDAVSARSSACVHMELLYNRRARSMA